MLELSVKTNQGKHFIQCPQSWSGEVSVDQYQRLFKEWDGEDWIQLFSIMSGLPVDSIAESKDGKLETALYQCIEFVFKPFDWASLPIPAEIDLKPIWEKDCPLISPTIKIPKDIGRLSIGQNIQARRSLEEVKDIREGISIVTAIYLQPLIDNSPFDHLRAIEIEQMILKNAITKIYPIGFFLLKRLNGNGSWLANVLNRLKRKSSKGGKT